MTCKVVFHLDWNEPDRLTMALNNVSNLLNDPSVSGAVVHVLANGRAVKLFAKHSDLSTASRIAELQKKGVRFQLCANALKSADMQRDDLIAGCEVVPAGIVELIRLQQEGFAYVKP